MRPSHEAKLTAPTRAQSLTYSTVQPDKEGSLLVLPRPDATRRDGTVDESTRRRTDSQARSQWRWEENVTASTNSMISASGLLIVGRYACPGTNKLFSQVSNADAAAVATVAAANECATVAAPRRHQHSQLVCACGSESDSDMSPDYDNGGKKLDVPYCRRLSVSG